ncbi:MAG: twin-arginine translocase TatA/TatE family subunit [Nitrospirota bacterium]
MFGLGAAEILLVVVIALVFFDPSRLPQLGKNVGSALRNSKAVFQGRGDEKGL